MATQNAQTAEARLSSSLAERMADWVPSRKPLIICGLALFLVGVGLRLTAWVCVEHHPHLSCEAVNIAISLAKTGRYADAYGVGVGPTAHCAPLHPLFLSVLFDVFGVNARGQLAMDVAASAASALAFAMLPALAVASGLPFICGALAGIAGTVLPLDFWFQSGGNFDEPFTAAALVGLCILVCRIRVRGRFAKREGVVLGITAGLGCLLSPATLPAICGWLLISAVEHRRQLRRMLIFSVAAGVCFMATVAPWAIRNYEVLGSPIWTRSNFWLEIHDSNNDWMTADEQTDYSIPQFALVHPYAGASERAEVKRLGEVAYMRAKRKQALTWIATHKRRFLELTAERFRLFWIPRMKRPIQTALEAALTILGLSGLVLLFRSRAAFAWIFSALVVLFPGVYYFIMVTPRFRVPLEPFLFLLAGYFCCSLLRSFDGHRRNKREDLLEFEEYVEKRLQEVR